MNPILLIGCGGHAHSIIELIETTGQWRIHGLVGLPEQIGNNILGYPVIGCDKDLIKLREVCSAVVLALGQLPDPAPRQRLAKYLEGLSFRFPVLISPHAVVSRHAQIDVGTTVGHGVIVNAAVKIGKYCTLNSRALLEHNVHVGDHCHISTGALVNGDVRIGAGSFIGSGSMIREGLKLPDRSVIGAGKRVMGWPLRNS